MSSGKKSGHWSAEIETDLLEEGQQDVDLPPKGDIRVGIRFAPKADIVPSHSIITDPFDRPIFH
jgi:hypothetical protein